MIIGPIKTFVPQSEVGMSPCLSMSVLEQSVRSLYVASSTGLTEDALVILYDPHTNISADSLLEIQQDHGGRMIALSQQR